jgi:hypothetical protein
MIMRCAIFVALLLASFALALPAVAQPGGVPGQAAFGAEMEAPPVPVARFDVSLTYAVEPSARMGQENVVGVIAYLASDPELRKRPDFNPPPIYASFTPHGNTLTATIAPDVFIAVGHAVEKPDGLDVQLVASEPGRRELLAAAATRVAEGLVPSKLPKEQRAKRVAELDEQLANVKDKIDLLRSISTNTAELGREILKDRIKAAELERQRLEMDLVAQRIRSDAIARQIERIREGIEKRLQDDDVLKQLREVIAMREEERGLARQLAKDGTAPQASVREAEEKILHARIRVTEREEAIRQTTSASLLERLNDELATNMINRAEMEARLELIRTQQPGIDVKQLDEAKLTRLTEEYRALFRDPGTLPPLYFQLEKQVLELRREKLALLVSGVKVSEAPAPTTAPQKPAP